MGDVLPEIGKNYAAFVLRRQMKAGTLDARRARLALDDLAALPAPAGTAPSPAPPRLHVMAGVAHPSGVMLPVTSSGVVLVYPLPTSPMPSPAVSRKSGDSGA
jgi:hypothetical protein